MTKEIENTNYPVKIYFDDDDEIFVAEFPDLPGCSAYGDSVDEAYQAAQTAKQGWLDLAVEQGLPIPKPTRVEEYSGRILLRLPSSLHASLVERAELQLTSLNQYAVHLLSAAIVGDSVKKEVEQLRAAVGTLQVQVKQLASSVAVSQAQMSQISGLLSRSADIPSMPFFQSPGGGAAYEALRGHSS